ncbi:oligosaccharide flippase family protein, partial [Photobacterium sanctipauli]
MQGLAKKAVKGLKWSAVERFLTQIIQLLIMIVLARLLGPKSYGLIGMLTIFIAISNVFVDSGFSAALIRKKNADNL